MEARFKCFCTITKKSKRNRFYIKIKKNKENVKTNDFETKYDGFRLIDELYTNFQIDENHAKILLDELFEKDIPLLPRFLRGYKMSNFFLTKIEEFKNNLEFNFNIKIIESYFESWEDLPLIISSKDDIGTFVNILYLGDGIYKTSPRFYCKNNAQVWIEDQWRKRIFEYTRALILIDEIMETDMEYFFFEIKYN